MAVFRPPPSPHIGASQPLEPRKLPPSITAVPEDNPPFGIPIPSFGLILRSWQPGPPRPWFGWSVPASIEAVPEDNPPFGIPHPAFSSIIFQWQPGPPMPWMGWKVNPTFEAVPEDNPPFAVRSWLSPILVMWEPLIYLPPQPGKIIQEGAVVAEILSRHYNVIANRIHRRGRR